MACLVTALSVPTDAHTSRLLLKLAYDVDVVPHRRFERQASSQATSLWHHAVLAL